VLSLEQLGVSFTTPEGEITAVREFCLTVDRGECVGIVGESGAGKSQVFLAAMGLLPANGRVRGHARFGSIELIGQRPAELDRLRGSRIGLVFQDPMTSLTPHLSIGAQLAEPMVRHLALSWREARQRALGLLRRVHVTDPEQRLQQYPHELSGGMRQRVMIAIALACEPALLIADEPTTALDVTIQAQILSLLAELKREHGMAMVLITHDLGAVAGVADRVAVMQSGRIVELDSVSTVLKAPTHPYTRALLKAVPSPEPLPEQLSASVSGPNLDTQSREIVLELNRLSVSFDVRPGWFGRRAQLHALRDVSLQLHAGEGLGVVGESGSGKSTLVRAALQLIEPTSGRIVWLRQAVERLSPHVLKRARRDLQIIFQDPLASLDPRMTLGEIISEPLLVHRPELGARERAHAVAESLLRVGLSPQMIKRYPHELSGGQCQRVGIARAMVLGPRLLVCDEPVSALDVSIQEQIVRLLEELKREYGLCILFVSHNLAVVRRLCERVLVLYLGRMMELGPSDSLYARPLHPYTRALLDAVPIADPDIQPGRLTRVLTGEAPSPLAPPSGCVYRTRCAHATGLCREHTPRWERVEPSAGVACHRWRELVVSSES
jgi:oligopeptide/dipeptide ABC transporter ATP-binding protein